MATRILTQFDGNFRVFEKRFSREFFSLGVARCKWVLLAEQADAMDIEKLETVEMFGKRFAQRGR